MKGYNSKITGEYPELREKVQKIVDAGFKIQKLAELADVPYTNLYDWVCRSRRIRHESIPNIERAINVLKEMFANL